MKYKNQLQSRIRGFFITSAGNNGISFQKLLTEFDSSLTESELRTYLSELIRDCHCTAVFGQDCVNPSIKRLPDIQIDVQLRRIASSNLTDCHLYPTTASLEPYVDTSKFQGRPFSLRLAFAEPQLRPVFFELSVLAPYLDDPRFAVEFHDYCGRICWNPRKITVMDEQTEVRTRNSIRTFGLGYDQQRRRVIAMFLRYLSEMTPKHQQLWDAQQIKEHCWTTEEYILYSIEGVRISHISVYQAFVEEQRIVNELSSSINQRPMFRTTYELAPSPSAGTGRPREFMYLIRPTKKNYLNFVHALDKMVSENIDVKFFPPEIPGESKPIAEDGTRRVEQMGTLQRLGDWFDKWTTTEQSRRVKHSVTVFRKIRKERQKPAHKLGDDKYDEEYFEMQDELIDQAYQAMRNLREVLVAHPSAATVTIPDWLREDRVKRY